MGRLWLPVTRESVIATCPVRAYALENGRHVLSIVVESKDGRAACEMSSLSKPFFQILPKFMARSGGECRVVASWKSDAPPPYGYTMSLPASQGGSVVEQPVVVWDKSSGSPRARLRELWCEVNCVSQQ